MDLLSETAEFYCGRAAALRGCPRILGHADTPAQRDDWYLGYDSVERRHCGTWPLSGPLGDDVKTHFAKVRLANRLFGDCMRPIEVSPITFDLYVMLDDVSFDAAAELCDYIANAPQEAMEDFA